MTNSEGTGIALGSQTVVAVRQAQKNDVRSKILKGVGV